MSMTISELLARDEDGGTATPEDVAQAEAEVDEAARLVEALEDRVRDGADDITPDQIDQQRSLGRFARLRAEATRRRAEKTARAARLRACVELREEIEGFTDSSGAELAKLLTKVEKAAEAFVAAVDARNSTVSDWHRRMRELGIPPVNDLLRIPPAEHGHLGLAGGTLAAGERRIATAVSSAHHLDGLLAALRSRLERDMRLERLYNSLAGLDRTAPRPTAKHFYRGANGGVIARDEPYDASDIKRLGLTAITREEAEQA